MYYVYSGSLFISIATTAMCIKQRTISLKKLFFPLGGGGGGGGSGNWYFFVKLDFEMKGYEWTFLQKNVDFGGCGWWV